MTRDENSDAIPSTPDMFDRRTVCVKLGALNFGCWDGTTLCSAPSEEMHWVTIGPTLPNVDAPCATRLRIRRTMRRLRLLLGAVLPCVSAGPMPQVDPDIKTIADCERVAEQTGNQTKEADRPPQEC